MKNINANCMSPFPAIINAANNDKVRNKMLIGISKRAVKKLNTVALLSIRNFNEN